MHTLRKIAFILFTAAYLVICPLVLLYAFGYSIHPGAPSIVKTGLIYISTMPPGATVRVERRRYAATTPAMVRGLLPGAYAVEVDLPGYQPWSGAVPVEAEKSTALDRILLVPTEWKRSWLLPGPLYGIRQIPGTRFLLIRHGPALRDHVLYDWKTARVQPLAGRHAVLTDAEVSAAWSVPDSPALLIRLGSGAAARFLWIDLSGDEPRTEDLTGFIPAGARRITWDPLDRRHLFILHEGRLLRLHLPSGTLALVDDGIRGAGTVERTLYRLTRNGALLQADPDGADARLLAETPEWVERTGDDGRSVEIWAPARGRVLLRNARGDLFSPRPPARLAEGIDGLLWDPHRERALVWQKRRVGIVTWSDPPARHPSLRWIFEDGRNITQAAWVYEGSHVILHDGGRVKLLELAGTERPQVRDLFDLPEESRMVYVEGAGRMFYVNADDGALWAVEVLPRREPLSFMFPEWDETGPRAD